MKKLIFLLSILISPNLYAATLTPNTIPYVCQGGTSPQLCSSGNIYGIVPTGGIIEWYGSIARIPSGWALCNGVSVERTDGTGMITPPDLRNRFVVGAYQDVAGVANTTVTGSNSVNGNGQLPSTNVSGGIPDGTCTGGGLSGLSANDCGSSSVSSIGSFGSGSSNVAVYYALAYIMKT